MAAVKFLAILAGFFALLDHAAAQNEGYCLSNDYEPYLLFGTKTAYEFVKGKDNNQHIVPGCQPVQFWSLNRHGTRLPGENAMEHLPDLQKTRDAVVSNYEVRRTYPDQGRLCSQDLENIKNWAWKSNYEKKFANDLTFQGYDDLKYMAKRWQSKYRDILPSTYSPRDYMFRFTDKRRTKESFRAFADGLFGKDAIASIRLPDIMMNDTILQGYEICETYQRDLKENTTLKEQMNFFKMKEEYRNMIKNVSSHLGYAYGLEEKTIHDIYDMCRYDKAWEINKNSAWCSAFTKDQLKLMEYAEDLLSYYESGYGNSYSKMLGCMPLKDMMEKFTRTLEHPNQDHPKAIIYFTHSKAIQNFLTALNIAHDTVPLLADNYHTPNIQRRKWKTSIIDPFASNLAAVLYTCSQSEPQVMFYLNEKPVEFEDCKVGLCSWDLVKRKYESLAKECSFRFCNPNSASYGSLNNYILGLTIVVMLIGTKSL